MTADTFYKEAQTIIEEVRDDEIAQAMINWGDAPAVPELYEPAPHKEASDFHAPVMTEDGQPAWLEILADFPVTSVPATGEIVQGALSEMG